MLNFQISQNTLSATAPPTPTFVDDLEFAALPTSLHSEVTFIVVSPAVTPTHGVQLEGTLAGTLGGPLYCQATLSLLRVLRVLLSALSLGHLDDVGPSDALLLPHQTLVSEGHVPHAVIAAHGRQNLGALEGLTPCCLI